MGTLEKGRVVVVLVGDTVSMGEICEWEVLFVSSGFCGPKVIHQHHIYHTSLGTTLHSAISVVQYYIILIIAVINACPTLCK